MVSGPIAAFSFGFASRIWSSICNSCVLPIEHFSMRFVSIHVMHAHSSADTATSWKKSHFILSERSDIHMIDNLPMADRAVAWHVLISPSIDETRNRNHCFKWFLICVWRVEMQYLSPTPNRQDLTQGYWPESR